MIYTRKDHVTLKLIEEMAGFPNTPFRCHISNRQLSERLGISVSGAAARFRRLEELGVIEIHYDMTVDAGRNVMRSIVVTTIPDSPWGF